MPETSTSGSDSSVVIVGAGLAGLCAARRLVANDVDVTVLEARGRVGGRTEGGQTADGTPVELGGQWIGAGQTRMYELVDELGLRTFPTYNEGQHVTMLGGKPGRLGSKRGAVPKLSPFALLDLFNGLRKFNRLADRVELDEPWNSPGAMELDSRTLATWIRQNLWTEVGRSYFKVATEAVFSADPADISLLHSLFYAHSGADLENLLSVDRGAQQDRVVGGSIRIAEELAVGLGDRVVTDSPVARIVQTDDEVQVWTRGGKVHRASRAMVTLPPTLAGRLDYQPALPSCRDQLTQKLPAGSVIKFHVVYDDPFWRRDGLTGQVASDQGPVKVTFDNSPPSGSPGIIVGFFEAEEGRRWAMRTEHERQQVVIDDLERYFGPSARSSREYIERDWMAEEFTRGCYGAHFAPGVWTAFGHALRTPIGRISWAGAECSAVWNGYMEGAVRSGERAADDILAASGAHSLRSTEGKGIN